MSSTLASAAIVFAEMAPVISRWFSASDDSFASTQMLANRIVEIAKRVTGTKDPETAAKSLQGDPKLLIQFQYAIAKLDQEMEQAFLQDRMSARQRDAAIATAGRRNTRADVMVFSAAAGLISCLLTLGFYSGRLPGEAVGIISTIAGIFGACLKDAYAFEFGSSRGSKEKDLAMMLEKIK